MNDVVSLLRTHGDEALLEELARWEALRAQLPVAACTPPVATTARTLFTLDGIPGAGKSTTQRWLQPALGAAYFSMARFAEARGVSADERREHQLATRQPHPVDVAFLEQLAACPSRFVVLEKFPRSVVESAAMLEFVRRHGWRFEVLHLQLPGDAVTLSTQRQIERGPRHGRMPEPDYARHRALVHLSRATSGRETLRAAGVPIHAFDMTRPEAENRAAIRRALGLDASALGFPRDALAQLERTARALGVEGAWVGGGAVYRAFWNDRFGPTQRPTDLDVAVEDERASQPLLQALERDAPDERWSVLSPAARLQARWGLRTDSSHEAKHFTTFLHRGGLVRLREGRIELLLPPGVEASLWSGSIGLNERLLERLTPAQRAELLTKETHHLPRALSDYPGLAIEPATSEALRGGAHWRDHKPDRILAGWHALKREVVRTQAGNPRAASPHRRRALRPSERPLAHALLQLHREREPRAAPPSLPPRRPIPERGELLTLAREADDATFGCWVLEQIHHHRPLGGRDPLLHAVLDGSLFSSTLRTPLHALGPMHQGFTLGRHLAQALLELRTDALLEPHTPGRREELRLALRLAMLFHDVGKLAGERPQPHGLVSARLFQRLHPPAFPAHLLPLTCWLIRTHDLFGAFARGLTEKEGHPIGDYALDPDAPSSYAGALDADAARAALRASGLPLDEAAALHGAVWSADVGSIASLRWLQPVAPLVAELLVRGGREARAAWSGTERRRAATVSSGVT